MLHELPIGSHFRNLRVNHALAFACSAGTGLLAFNRVVGLPQRVEATLT